MPNTSSKTKALAFRAPIDVSNTIERRAKKKGKKVSEWLRDFITYDARRKR